MKKIAILASGEGTNAAQMVLYFREKQSAEVALVLTNRADAGVCRRMERLQVPLRHVSALEFKEGKALPCCMSSTSTSLPWPVSC